MKIYVCLAISLLSVSLCIADGPAVIALSECDCPGIIFGSSSPIDNALTIFNSGMHINSPYNPGGADGAIDQIGNADVLISANYINVVGGIDERFDFPENMYVHEYPDMEPVPDPYAYLPDHDLTAIRALEDKGTISNSNTYSPGYYSGGIKITDPSTTVTLLPGDYYLDSFKPDSTLYRASMSMLYGTLTGDGVTLHIIGDGDYGIDVTGNPSIDISAPTSGPYESIAIYQKRDPDYSCEESCVEPWNDAVPLSEFNGLGNIIFDGGVYMPHNRLELSGTGYMYMTRVVADRFYVNGTAEKIVHNSNYYIPGDLIKNGEVDFDDLIFFCSQWGLELSTNIYIESNLNYDLHIDLNDFAIFAGHWLEVTE